MKVKEESKKVDLKLNSQLRSWHLSHHLMANKWGNSGTVTDFILGGSKITADGDYIHEIKITPWKKSYDQLRKHIKKQKHYFANKGPSSQSYGFSSGHAWM